MPSFLGETAANPLRLKTCRDAKLYHANNNASELKPKRASFTNQGFKTNSSVRSTSFSSSSWFRFSAFAIEEFSKERPAVCNVLRQW
jgi:hypothetical protein